MAKAQTAKRGPKAPPRAPNRGVASTLLFERTAAYNPLIDDIPWMSLERFRSGTAVGTDWFKITLRINLNIEMAKEFYEPEAMYELQKCQLASLQINVWHQLTGKWHATPEEIESLRMALEASETIQKENTVEQKASAYAKVLRELNS